MEAAEVPGCVEDLAEEFLFELALGLRGLAEALLEELEGFLFALGDDEGAGGEAVEEAVHGGAGLAFFGAGAGGELRVFAIGVELRVGSHDGEGSTLLQGFWAGLAACG
jgi:hypothetical protein